MENPTKTKEENLRDYKTISAVYPAILNVANQYYDIFSIYPSRTSNVSLKITCV